MHLKLSCGEQRRSFVYALKTVLVDYPPSMVLVLIYRINYLFSIIN